MSLLQTSVITAKPIWLFLDPNDTSGSSCLLPLWRIYKLNYYPPLMYNLAKKGKLRGGLVIFY